MYQSIYISPSKTIDKTAELIIAKQACTANAFNYLSVYSNAISDHQYVA
jgi:hypothetical protein